MKEGGSSEQKEQSWDEYKAAIKKVKEWVLCQRQRHTKAMKKIGNDLKEGQDEKHLC